MGMSLVEKILARHSKHAEVKAGQIIDVEMEDRKSKRLNSSHRIRYRMQSSA